MAIALDIAMAMDMARASSLFLNLDSVCILTQLGEYRKIQAFGFSSSLGLRPQKLPQPHAGISLYSLPLI